jgi:hypothetical protein
VGISSIPLDLTRFGGHKLGYGVLMRCSYYPQSLVQIRGAIREIGVGFGGVDSRVLFISSCPGLTGLCDRSDRYMPLVGFASGELLDSCVFGSWCDWSVLGPFGVFCKAFCRVFLPCRLCFGSVLVPGPREVTEALWNTCCAAAVATGLTGSVHWSDRCHRSDRRRPSV